MSGNWMVHDLIEDNGAGSRYRYMRWLQVRLEETPGFPDLRSRHWQTNSQPIRFSVGDLFPQGVIFPFWLQKMTNSGTCF